MIKGQWIAFGSESDTLSDLIQIANVLDKIPFELSVRIAGMSMINQSQVFISKEVGVN